MRAAATGSCELFYWRDGTREVDFVVRIGKRIAAIEVKSGRRRDNLPGVGAFAERHRVHRKLLVGADGIPIDVFLGKAVGHWLRA